MKKILLGFILSFLFINLSYSDHELIGLVDQTTKRGIPDARTIFLMKSGGVVTNLEVNGWMKYNNILLVAENILNSLIIYSLVNGTNF